MTRVVALLFEAPDGQRSVAIEVQALPPDFPYDHFLDAMRNFLTFYLESKPNDTTSH